MSATQAQITAVAEALQERAGTRFRVHPNGYGVLVRCLGCGISATHDRAYLMVANHDCSLVLS
jgi:hypothetical protein